MAQGALLNPYWVLWWATVGMGQLASLTAKHGARAWPVFFAGHILADYVWYIFIAVLVALSGRALNPAFHHGLIVVCGLGTAVLGVLFIIRPVREIARLKAREPAVVE